MTSGSTLSDVRRSSKEAKRWLKSPTTSWCHPFKALDAIWFQHCLNSNSIFPECVARVPVSLWGSGGWGCVKLDVALASVPVRNRSRDCYMAVPMVSFAEVVIFGGFKRLVASFRVASVALRDIQMCFVTCRKLFCVAGAILLRRFQKMRCSFRGRRSTLDVSIVIFRGRRSTLDVSCWVFFANRIGSGHKLQIPWQAWHFLTCAENWRKPRTKQNLDVPTKTRRKTSILKLQSVTIGRSLARNARLGAPTCLVSGYWFSGGFAVSMGEAAKHVLSACFKLWKLEEVSYEMLVLMFLRVLSRVSGFPVASPCLWGKLQNLFSSKVSKQVVMSFCVAGVALCDIPTSLLTCRKCQNWRKSRTKCVFCCIHVSCLESLVFLWRRRVYGGSCKTSPLRRFPSKLSCRFAWQAWHFVTFQPLC